MVEKRLFFKTVSVSFSISAIFLITIAIASENGITYHEDNILIKLIEITISCFAVIYLLYDLRKDIIKG